MYPVNCIIIKFTAWWIFTYTYICVTNTLIKKQNIFSIPEVFFMSFVNQYPPEITTILISNRLALPAFGIHINCLKQLHMVFVWLLLLSMLSVRLIHVAVCGSISSFSSCIVVHYMTMPYFIIYCSLNGHLYCYKFLALKSKADTNIYKYMSLMVICEDEKLASASNWASLESSLRNYLLGVVGSHGHCKWFLAVPNIRRFSWNLMANLRGRKSLPSYFSPFQHICKPVIPFIQFHSAWNT